MCHFLYLVFISYLNIDKTWIHIYFKLVDEGENVECVADV